MKESNSLVIFLKNDMVAVCWLGLVVRMLPSCRVCPVSALKVRLKLELEPKVGSDVIFSNERKEKQEQREIYIRVVPMLRKWGRGEI